MLCVKPRRCNSSDSCWSSKMRRDRWKPNCSSKTLVLKRAQPTIVYARDMPVGVFVRIPLLTILTVREHRKLRGPKRAQTRVKASLSSPLLSLQEGLPLYLSQLQMLRGTAREGVRRPTYSRMLSMRQTDTNLRATYLSMMVTLFLTETTQHSVLVHSADLAPT